VGQSQAIISFFSGDVSVSTPDGRRPVTVGAYVTAGQTLATGEDSTCELQIGATAVVLVEERTEVVIEDLLVKAGGTRATLKVEEGSVLSKVAKLSDGEAYRVRTRSAVCGVRGTEFAVSVSDKQTAVVAVRTGAVYVLPARADASALKADEARAVYKRLEESAPAVAAGEEMPLTQETMGGMEEALDDVIAEVERLGAQDTVNAGETEALLDKVESSLPALKELTPSTQPMSAERRRSIQKLDQAVFLPVAVQRDEDQTEAKEDATQGPALFRIDLTTVPDDAIIAVNGRPAGKGRFQAIFPEGTRLSFAAGRDGYRDAALTVAVTKDGEKTFRLTLEAWPTDEPAVSRESETPPAIAEQTDVSAAGGDQTETAAAVKKDPLIGVYKIAAQGFIGSLTAAEGKIFGADRSGTVYAVNASGKLAWKLGTANNPNNNSSPIVIGGRVYFSGLRELVIADAAGGKPLARIPLEGAANHMFGRHVISGGGTGVLPEDRALRFFNLATGAATKTVPLPTDTRMTPTLYNGKLYLIDAAGALQVCDPVTGTLDPDPLPTGAAEPIAIRITVSGYRGYAAGRRNKLVCLDLAAKKMLWEKDIANPEYAYQDLEADGRGVFAYAGKTLFAFSPQGKPLFAPLKAVSAPPLLKGDYLFVGTTAGQLRALDPRTGAVRASLDLKKTVSARPVLAGGRLVVGTAGGEIILIDPNAL
jgi:outer membrane protein assembly factor BamB